MTDDGHDIDLKMGKEVFFKEPIAIVGLGCVLPGGIGAENFWNFLLNKGYAIKEIDPKRWDPAIYWDEDWKAPEKTYSKIGGWVEGFEFDFMKFRIPPNMAKRIDNIQTWALASASQALEDAGLGPDADFDRDNTAIIIAQAMGGEGRDKTTMKIRAHEVEWALKQAMGFKKMTPDEITKGFDEVREILYGDIPTINEDSMPGELSNVTAGRISNRLNLRGESFTTDAACASSMAALAAAVRGLQRHDFNLAVAGGSDQSNGVASFVKFCKIGALSNTMSCPFDDRADGFVMGEGTSVMVLKRLSDAVRDQNKIYALITGIGSSSDGKGKGITAPNPVGQKLAIERAFKDADIKPEMLEFIEAHGTSTIVGDEAEAKVLLDVFKDAPIPKGTLPLGSVKGNIGHLKAGAGAAAMLKMALTLSKKTIPPQAVYEIPNHKFDIANSPFRIPTEPEPWTHDKPYPRRGGVSSFGFGGTNFHIIMEEYDAQYAQAKYLDVMEEARRRIEEPGTGEPAPEMPKSFEGDVTKLDDYKEVYKQTEIDLITICADDPGDMFIKVGELIERLTQDGTGPFEPPRIKEIAHEYNSQIKRSEMRLVVTGGSAKEIVEKLQKALKAAESPKPEEAFMMLARQGVFFNPSAKKKQKGKVGFLFPGQGSQYINMLRDLRERFSVVRETFDEADQIMDGLISKPLSEFIFYPEDLSEEDKKKAAHHLKQTEITQPAMITADIAMMRLLNSYGINADIVIGHSLGEYGALVASGAMKFKDALVAVSTRGKEMQSITDKVNDVGKMISVSADTKTVEKILKKVKGYAIPANKNCNAQTVVAGETEGVAEAVKLFEEAGIRTMYLPVSAAFHSKIVSPAEKPLRKFLEKLDIKSPDIDILCNVTGDYYPKGKNAKKHIIDLLEKQVSSPVEFQKEVEKMYKEGVRVFVEVGPKRALTGFTANILEGKKVFPLMTDHPKRGGMAHFMDVIAFFVASGHDVKLRNPDDAEFYNPRFLKPEKFFKAPRPAAAVSTSTPVAPSVAPIALPEGTELNELQELGARAKIMGFYPGSISVSGVGLGLPGKFKRVFDDKNTDLILDGANLIDPIDMDVRQRFVDKNINKLVKGADGRAHFEAITDKSQVLKLAGQMGIFDLVGEYGVDQSLAENIDISTALAMAAGIEALRDAGIPLVRKYKKTTTGSYLPMDWQLPEDLQDDTGVIFSSAFPGIDKFAGYLKDYYTSTFGQKAQAQLMDLFTNVIDRIKDPENKKDLAQWFAKAMAEYKDSMNEDDLFHLSRKFLFNVLTLGHAQFAQFIKAKGPAIHNNAACATTTQAVAMAEDMIRSGRCKRVILISGDSPTSDNNIEWLAGGMLANGAATTEENVEDAALPFDKRRKGLILGMGATGMVVEREENIKLRGMDPIVEVMGTWMSNSAFHGSNLDPPNLGKCMDKFWDILERRYGFNRMDMAKDIVFISHETYTPARGGSASGEVKALQAAFKDKWTEILVSNTKGFTGHPYGAGIEDVIAIRALQKGKIPPIANYKVPDPELVGLNLSTGVNKPFTYALRLAAGFGSQVAFALYKIRNRDEKRIIDPNVYNQWLLRVSKQNTAEIEVVNRTLRIKDDGTWVKKRGEPSKPMTSEHVSQIPGVVPAKKPAQALAASGLKIDRDAIRNLVTSMVVKQTGFNKEMVDPDLDFDSDLGVDSVKQVEIFNALRDEFKLPEEVGLKLNDFSTANDITDYIAGRLELAVKIMSQVTQNGYLGEAAPAGPAPAAAPAPSGGLAAAALPMPGGPAATSSAPAPVPAAAPVPSAPAPAPVPAAAPVPSAPAPAAPAGEDITSDQVMRTVLNIIVDKTGYPEDMLEPELDMEADLGIDTVKQVEIFQMIRDEYGLEREDNVKLSDYPTIKSVVGYIFDRLEKEGKASVAAPAATPTPVPDAASSPAAPAPAAQAAPAPSGGITSDEVMRTVLNIVVEKTGYPEDMLEAELDMEADLGIDTVKQVEIFQMIRDEYGLEREEGVTLSDYPTIRSVVDYIYGRLESEGKATAGAAPAPAAPAPAPAAAPTPAAPAPEAATPAGGGITFDQVMRTVLSIVVEKTGYPEDMLEAELDMEADLGIDTVKQVEIFQMIRDEYGLEREEGVTLSDYPTIQSVVNYIFGRLEKQGKTVAGGAAPAAPAPAAPAPAAPTPAPAPAAPTPAPAPAAPAPSPVATAPAASAAADTGEVMQKVIAVVVEKTGYPEDMLEPDLDMEADLGIDTVKQVEVFQMIRDEYGLEREEGVSLSDYPTIQSVVDYIIGRLEKEGRAPAPTSAAAEVAAPATTEESSPAPAAPAPSAPGAVTKEEVLVTVLKCVVEKTGYPEDMLEPQLDMEADLGIDTVKQVEVFQMIRDEYGLEREDGIKLSDYPTIESVVDYIHSRIEMANDAVAQADSSSPVESSSDPPASPTTGGTITEAQVLETVLKCVVEKTGYPEDMLEPQLDMEADLGIDTVKQVEVFQMIRDEYGLEREDGIKLSDYPTIESVVGYILSRIEAEGVGEGATTTQTTGAVEAEPDEFSEEGARLRRYQVRMVENPNKRDSPRFILKGWNICLVADNGGLYKKVKAKLEKEKAKVSVIRYSNGPGKVPKDEFVGLLDQEREVEPIIKRIKKTNGPIKGVINLMPLDKDEDIGKMDFEAWNEMTKRKVKSLFGIVKEAREDLEAGAKDGGSFFVSITQSGGSFGIDSYGSPTPIDGGVWGITKAISKEFPDSLVKAIDLSEGKTPAATVNTILDEIQLGDAQVEVAYKGGKRFVTRMGHVSLDESSKPNFKPDKDWVFIVTGGGFGITAEIVKDICREFKSKIMIIDIVTMPENIEEIVKMDEAALAKFKDSLKDVIKNRGDKLTPVALEREFKKYSVPRDIYINMEEMKKLGSEVEFFSCDVTDNKGMKRVLDDIRKKHKRIDAIIHGAGLEISKTIDQKPYDQFALVFDVKANGAYNLFEQTRKDKVKVHVTFGSVAGRFGNNGQTDYSAANDLLNKYCALNNTRYKKGFKAISLNWTGWRQVGMATRGSLLGLFDMAGVTLIPTSYGAPMVRKNILYAKKESEVTIAGDVGFLDKDLIITDTEVNKELLDMEKRLIRDRHKFSLIDNVIELEGDKVTVVKRLDVETDLYLKDHAIEGTPLLPGVMGIESFTQVASLMHPKMHVQSIEEVKFLKPIKLLKSQPLVIRIRAETVENNKDSIKVFAQIESDFFNQQGAKMGEPRIHFSGTVVLGKTKPKAKKGEKFEIDGAKDPKIGFDDVYHRFFHGPTFQVLPGVDKIGAQASLSKYKEPEGRFFTYIDKPEFFTNPMFRESGFQSAGMFFMYTKDMMSLPYGVGKVESFAGPKDKMDSCRVIFKGQDDRIVHFDVEILNPKGEVIDRMVDYQMVITGEVPQEYRFNKV